MSMTERSKARIRAVVFRLFFRSVTHQGAPAAGPQPDKA